MENKNPILGKGEQLIEPASKKNNNVPRTFPYTYMEAKTRLKIKIKELDYKISQIDDEYKLNNVVATLRLNKKFLAKSYVPNSLFRYTGMDNIGSRRWFYYEKAESKNVLAKMHFVKINKLTLKNLNDLLDKSELELTDGFKEDIRKIEDFDMIMKEEIVQGFDEEWNQGSVELVFHPFDDEHDELIELFNNILQKNGENTNYKIKKYANGPTFINAKIGKTTINELTKFNPLRTVHPLEMRDFPELRNASTDKLPINPPKGTSRSNIKLGVFDGGINENHPFLEKYVTKNHLVTSEISSDGILHGTAVAGAVLYGNLSDYKEGEQLSDPIINIEDFRVLPPSGNTDFELYEAIDVIENIVPSREDIKVYNLSFGPVGIILDDEVSRFTYALDRLAWENKVLFVIAVGNDGDLEVPFNRIQAPSDIVNGLGVGAYTLNIKDGEIVRANYSSVGIGREGCKVKPDVCGFGGDKNVPIHLLHYNKSKKMRSMGTSFASPIIAGKAAEILGRCEEFNSLSARAMLIHNAKHKSVGDNELGHGYINQGVDEILYTDKDSVTIVYQNSIQPGKMAKMPIPFPNNIEYKGLIEFSWTTAIASKVNPLHSEDYTNSCVVDTFYPHSKKYNFNPPEGGNAKVKHLETDSEEIESLIRENWKQSFLPVSASAKKYKNEADSRFDFKWDTVVRNKIRKQRASIDNPFIILHGMGRNDSSDLIHYSTVITIKLNNYNGDILNDILNEYRVLQPVNIRNRNEIMLEL